jgi:hypothetical protein
MVPQSRYLPLSTSQDQIQDTSTIRAFFAKPKVQNLHFGYIPDEEVIQGVLILRRKHGDTASHCGFWVPENQRLSIY